MKRISLHIFATLALALMLGATGAGSASAAVGTNVLMNPGVETGNGTTPDYWTFSYWGTNIAAAGTWSTDAHAGSHALRTEITAYNADGDAKWWPQPATVTGATYYALSDWYKSNRVSAVSVEYWTSGQDTTKDGTWVNLNSRVAPASGWTLYQTGFTMPKDAVKAIFVHFIAGAGWLVTDDYAITEQAAPAGFTTPIISLTFDDGMASFFDHGSYGSVGGAKDLLDARGYKTTQYIPTSDIGLTGRMTAAQITTLAAASHEIASHSADHPDLTGVASDDTLAWEFTSSKSALEGTPGVGAGQVTGFAYPYGTYDARVIAAAQAGGYTSGRSVEQGYNSKIDVNPYDLRVQNVTWNTTLDQFKSWVDYAKANNTWLIIVYHEVMQDPGRGQQLPHCTGTQTTNCLGDYDTINTLFKSQLDWINSSGLSSNVKTIKQALAAAAPQAAPSLGTVALTPAQPTTDATLTATPNGFFSPAKSPLTYTYTWKLNGTVIPGATASTLDLKQAGTGTRGDTITVEVFAHDQVNGLNSPTSATSAKIVDAPPTSGTVAITPASPKAGAALTAVPNGFTDADGDALTFNYQWSVKGVTVPGATAATFTPAGAVGGDVIAVTVTADDGNQGTSASAGANVTLANTPPVKGSVTISPSSPKVRETLTATPTGFTDIDADVLNYSYRWSINGATVSGATGATYTLTSAVRGAIVSVTATADDGHLGTVESVSPNVTVDNTPPVKGSVTISPSSPKVGGTVTATPTGFSDADLDALTYSYQWSINARTITGATAPTFDLTTVVRGDLVAVSVSAADGHGGTSESVSTNVTVDNVAPSKGTVTIIPLSPKVGATLTATPAGFTDVDGDSFTYHYQWSLNGATVPGATEASYTLSKDTRVAEITVAVTADDGRQGISEPATAKVTLADMPPVKGSVAISPSSPTSDATLTASRSDFADPEGDPLVYTYQWSVNGNAIAGATTSTFDLSQAGHGDHGDAVAVTVTADDGFPGGKTDAGTSVTVANTPPVTGSVTISPPSPQAGTALTATPTEFADGDGDALSYQYAWFHNGQQIAGATGATLAGAAVLTGEIGVEVRATDGRGGTSEAASATISVSPAPVVDKSAPTVLIASPITKAYQLGSKLLVSFSCTDGSGIANCTATLGPVGDKAANVASGGAVLLAKTGKYLLTVSAKDGNGNATTKAVSFTVIDRIAPRIQVSSPKARTYRIGQKLLIKFSCTDSSGIAGYTATLGRDRTKPGKISSGKTIRLTQTGHYTLTITAKDHNGNATSKTLKFNVT